MIITVLFLFFYMVFDSAFESIGESMINFDADKVRNSVPEADEKEKIVVRVLRVVILLWLAPSWAGWFDKGATEYFKSLPIALPPLLGLIVMFLENTEDRKVIDFRDVMSHGVMWEVSL